MKNQSTGPREAPDAEREETQQQVQVGCRTSPVRVAPGVEQVATACEWDRAVCSELLSNLIPSLTTFEQSRVPGKLPRDLGAVKSTPSYPVVLKAFLSL